MVSTRRMESSGSTVDVSRLPRVVDDAGDNSESCSSSESEPSQEEESWSSQCPTAKQLRERRGISPNFIGGRVRELRNRFVCSNIAYSSKRLQGQVVRNCQSLDGRRRVYSRHEMQEDSDDFLLERDDSDEIFSPRHRRRHSSSKTSRRSSRNLDRSLRPLKNQCYADPHSSMTQSNSSGDEKPGREKMSVPAFSVRRSTRQRTLKYDTFNTSWITDAQMVRGYPNLKMDFLSDQDSRHSQENGHHDKHSGLRSSIRKARSDIGTRNNSNHHNGEVAGKREIKKNMKYIYDFETTEVRTKRVSLREPQVSLRESQVSLREPQAVQEDTKETKKNCTDEELPRPKSRSRGRTKESLDNNENSNSNDGNEEEVIVNREKTEENKKSTDCKEEVHDRRETRSKQENEKEEEEGDSESDNDIRRMKKRRRINYMDDPRYSPRKTLTRKTSESEKSSDSSDEDIRNQRYKYQLRQRKPKPDPITMPVRRSNRLVHNLSARRRRDRRRDCRDSTSDDSSDEPTRSRKSNKSKYIWKPVTNNNTEGQQLKSGPVGQAPAPIGPETLDKKVRFDSVGGLDNHVRCLREMVVLPMMYPEIFRQFQIQPPRGVLFHGPPGTGKTLLARALANECSFGSRKVSFFMRKGADLLSKWVGESEKQLRLLFEQAAQMKPSIIFFDELDGLAPVRSSRQDQIHASIVSTLLALMDGLDNRGEVIVIGATNRIDAIDPALRRPGRFDRELYFPLPARKEREEILRVHVSQWNLPPNEALIQHLAEQSAGYCGSDLRALCSEAVIQGLRRTYPQVYTTDYRLDLDPTQVKVEKIDFLRARSLLIPASHRVTQGLGRKLPTVLEALFKVPLDTVLSLFKESFPHGLDPALSNIKVSHSMQTAQLLLTGDGHAQGQSTYLAPALLYHMEHVNTYTLDLATLYKESARTAEEACVEVFREARRNVPSVIYIPCIEQWWSLVAETVRAIFLSELSQLDPNIPILFLATANVEYKELPEQISSIFSPYRKEVLHLSPPVTNQREAFFKPLIITASIKPPKIPKERPKTPPPLPRAPTPAPEPLSDTELKKVVEKEEATLRELRIFLRDMCKKMASNKMFYMFTKPVDLEEVPDYLTIIKQPMDLETMMTKVDLHQYSSAQEFLADIDLICMNALEYNPAKTSADKQIRHRACSLRDYAYALIKAEMDSDFEEHCREITKKRKERKSSVTQFLPPFIHTVPNEDDDNEEGQKDNSDILKTVDTSTNSVGASPPPRKRKVPLWARGYLSNRKRKRSSRNVLTESHQQESEAQQDEVYKAGSVIKSSSGDESKENKPEDTEPTVCMLDASTLCHEQPIAPHASSDVHAPLTVNCDIASSTKVRTSPLSSNASKRSKFSETLSPAIWPSFADLIEDTPQVEDPDAEDVATTDKKVIVDKQELDRVLTHAVSVTRGCSILTLMDLYGQLNRVVNKFSRTHERNALPQDLLREISRFQEQNQLRSVSTSRCQTPAS